MDQTLFTLRKNIMSLKRLLSVLIGSYCVGWGILVFNIGSIQNVNRYIWAAAAAACFITTLWLAYTLSVRALLWWTTTVVSVVTVRSFAYISGGIINPLGVWFLVLTGVAITSLAVLLIDSLSEKMGGESA